MASHCIQDGQIIMQPKTKMKERPLRKWGKLFQVTDWKLSSFHQKAHVV